jgi:hypothetical protein
MSTKVKERLKRLRLEMTHEERIMLDEMLDNLAIEMGLVIIKDQRACDALIEKIPDDRLIRLVERIKKRRKRQAEVMVEA